jgi:undecaprenyl-diphosphatase
MIETLYGIDRSIYVFINSSLSNPFSDVLGPFFSGLTSTWYGISILVILWLFLFLRGGREGKIVALLIIPLVAISDQLSSAVIKQVAARARPCHEINGKQVVDTIRLLVPCGSGYSFPSSHATNAFAVASFVAHSFHRWRIPLLLFACAVALSRVVVGVHYPSDVAGGALIGVAVAYTLIFLRWTFQHTVMRSQTGSVSQVGNGG